MAKIHQLGSRIFARLLKEHGIEEINPAQGWIMFVLWRADNIPIVELARRTAGQAGPATAGAYSF